MRFVAALLLSLGASIACAERILLIPLDSRPATGQFAQMIAKMANVEVAMPPYETLGRFTRSGNPALILDWLAKQDLSDVTAAVVSTDMVAYGGLIASRINTTPADIALRRIRKMDAILRKAPNVRIFAFSSTMRLTPTATNRASKFRMQLAKYEEAKAKFLYTGEAAPGLLAKRLKPAIPAKEIADYEATRARNHAVQESLIRMQGAKKFEYLVIGQDDARPFGPHVGESEQLRTLSGRLQTGEGVFFCEGIDQLASMLVSRALLTQHDWRPTVRVVFSDEAGKKLYANFESKPIADSLRDQLDASGARLAGPNDEYDYTLYLNTPGRNEAKFKRFLADLESDVDQGFPTAVADIDLGRNGTADPELFEGLWENRRMMSLLSYAGWNTAGNTMGTSIPAANVYLLARRLQVEPLLREVAQREFLLHRFVNDYAYHKFTRPAAYKMIKDMGLPASDEIYGQSLSMVDDFVRTDLTKRLNQYFQDQFLGRRFFAGTEQYAFNGITDVKVWLPWPRVYEVRLQFHLQATPVTTPSH